MSKEKIQSINTPLVSIITVVYNADFFLDKFLKNVFSFKSSLVEIIIIDGKSTDNTIKILEQNDKNIDFWLSEKDLGIYDAMNKATKFAKGKWFYFIGVDDIILPDFKIMMERLVDEKTIYYGNVIHNGKCIISKSNKKNIARYNICHQAIFYPKSVFNSYNYNIKYNVNADYQLNILCFGDKTHTFLYYNLNIAIHTSGGYSSTAIDGAFAINKTKLIKENLGLIVYIKYLWHNKRGCLKKAVFFLHKSQLIFIN